jgi:hypothetical protein
MSALNWLKPAVLMAGIVLAAAPVQAQGVTILGGTPPEQPPASVDCKNPYYAPSRYCQAYDAWLKEYYRAEDYGDADSSYAYGLPVGVGPEFRFRHGGNFPKSFHGGRFHDGGFRGRGFHAGSFHGGDFSGAGGHR